MSQHKVGVFQHERGPGRKPHVTAYTRDYSPSWQDCCVHHVDADNGADAKVQAIADHRAGIGCRGSALGRVVTEITVAEKTD